ncbi:NAD(P)H-hydrate dehydratase [Qipengyuania marisflavi]|uniref:ADP-dependent (S)-NAD(P)H-hydrate dehydratase n=2 Tax=Qipengyuania marisflavi TaxID=2486356 RepID=A0A5S3PAI5_9SPHN|nr:NAD(P)H-hydrate dehydratase [Qipengyuania marisflavi]
MQAAERAAMAAGTSSWELMRRAGEGAAQWVARAAAGRAVTVLCGPGNNSGDGYVIAESLRRRGTSVTMVAPVEPKTETARTARSAYSGEVLTHADGLDAPIFVDCLFGYGLSREVGGEFAKTLQKCAASHSYKIAIDVPSGVASDTGALLGDISQYNLTLALGAWKQAHFLMPAAPLMGELKLVPIGLDFPQHTASLSSQPHLSPPAADAHKYRRGLLAIVAGTMPGAPLLAAQAAMHSGAGYVKLMSAHSHPDAPAELVIEGGNLSGTLADDRIAALLIGPGLGRTNDARDRLSAALETGKPCVLDADALHLIDEDMLEGVDATRLIVTPHEGELASLCRSFGVTAQGKLASARALHGVTALTVLAKGPDTVLVGQGAVRFFPRGSSWLSVAGTGDVLAGILAARLAHHGDPVRAGEEAVWLHHTAACLAAPAFTAGQLAAAVKPAIARLL